MSESELIRIASVIEPMGLSYNDQATVNQVKQKRTTVQKTPNQTGNITSSSNRTATIFVDGDGFLDTQNTYLTFDAVAELVSTPGEGTPSFAFNDSTETWVEQIQIKQSNGTLIDNVKNCGTLGAVLKRSKNATYRNSIGRTCLNEGLTLNERETKSETLHNYVLEFQTVPFLNSHNYHPLKALAGNNSYSYSIEIIFRPIDTIGTKYNTVEEEAVTDVWKYTISNVRLMCDIVHDNPKQDQIQAMIMRGEPIMMHYTSYAWSNNILPANSGGNQTINISQFQESIKSIKTVFRNLEDVNSAITDNTIFRDGDVINYYYGINSTYYPAQPIYINNGNAQQYYEYSKSNEKNKRNWDLGFNTVLASVDAGVLNISTANQDFIIDQNLKIFMSDSNGSSVYNDFFSGINTRSNPNVINGLFQCDTHTNAQNVDSFVEYDNTLMIEFFSSRVLS